MGIFGHASLIVAHSTVSPGDPESIRVLDEIIADLDSDLESEPRMRDLMLVVKLAAGHRAVRSGSSVLRDADLEELPAAAALRPLRFMEADEDTWVVTSGNCSRPSALQNRVKDAEPQ